MGIFQDKQGNTKALLTNDSRCKYILMCYAMDLACQGLTHIHTASTIPYLYEWQLPTRWLMSAECLHGKHFLAKINMVDTPGKMLMASKQGSFHVCAQPMRDNATM